MIVIALVKFDDRNGSPHETKLIYKTKSSNQSLEDAIMWWKDRQHNDGFHFAKCTRLAIWKYKIRSITKKEKRCLTGKGELIYDWIYDDLYYDYELGSKRGFLKNKAKGA